MRTWRRWIDTSFRRRGQINYVAYPALSELAIQRTNHRIRTLPQNMGVDLRRADIAMTQQLLYGANIVARFQQMRRERVAQRMARGVLDDARIVDCAAHVSLQRRFV